jgi:nucleotide-binding universal stress UspA family protein
MMNRILVPLDGSAFAESALPAALDLARAMRAELHLVQVHEYLLPVAEMFAGDDTDPTADATGAAADAELQEQVRQQELARLDGLADECARRVGLRARTELLEGPVVPTLADYVAEAGITTVVMTTHGRGGLNRVWLGSVADALVREVSVPVLLLRPPQAGVPGHGLAGVRTVVVALDGSPLAEAMLAPAAGLARALGAGLTLFHASPPRRRQEALADRTGDGAEVRRLDRELARGYLERQAAPLRAQRLHVETAVVTGASPQIALLEYTESHEGALLALATHGRNGWARVAIGSVADRVLRAATGPVLLFRPPLAATLTDGPGGSLTQEGVGHVGR